jgi:hypothetical protein
MKPMVNLAILALLLKIHKNILKMDELSDEVFGIVLQYCYLLHEGVNSGASNEAKLRGIKKAEEFRRNMLDPLLQEMITK